MSYLRIVFIFAFALFTLNFVGCASLEEQTAEKEITQPLNPVGMPGMSVGVGRPY